MKTEISRLGLRLLASFLVLAALLAGAYAHNPDDKKNGAKKVMFTHEYAEVNGVKLHYVKAGQGKKLIMFVHGFPEFWYEYKNQLEEFGKDYTAVAPDMRGYNLSSKPAELEKYAVRHMVE